MKKIIILITTVSLIALFIACSGQVIGTNQDIPKGSSANSQQSQELDKFDYKFFKDVANSGITSQTWDSASQISPESLVCFFGNTTGLSQLSTDVESVVISGDIVESYIQLYFAVDNKYIRQAMFYDSNNNTYDIPIPYDGAASAKVVAVSEKDDIISLSYEYYSPSDDITVIREGTLDIQILEPYFKYNYISCSTTDKSQM